MVAKLSIIVPCYNESGNLDRLVEAFAECLALRSDMELLLVDNGSADDTPDKLQAIQADPKFGFVRSVRVEVNQGYGFGIMSGLRAATSEFVAWTHADLQTPPADVVTAFEQLCQMDDPTNSLVRGNRMGRPIFDAFFTNAMGWVASLALKSHLYDVNAQPKVFHRSLLDRLGTPPDDFTLDLYLLHCANQMGLAVKTIPVRFEDRTSGESKGGGTLRGKYKLSKRTLGQIWNLRNSLNQGTVGTSPRESVSQQPRQAA